VRFNDNAVVTFGAGTFNMKSLDIGKKVTVNVTDNTILQIDQGWSNNINLKFGVGTNAGCKIYIGAYGFNVTTTRATGFSTGAEVHAQYFAPTGWLDIGGTNNIYGRYWAMRITGDPNNNVYFQVPTTTTTSIQITTTTTVPPTTTTTSMIPTLIELQSFTTKPCNKAVILKWQTESEIDNVGFNILRSESEDGEYIKINDALIPAEGSASNGASYKFTDTGLNNRQTYYYMLEDLDANGTATKHGPVEVIPRLWSQCGKYSNN